MTLRSADRGAGKTGPGYPSCPKTVFRVWGSLFKPVTHQTTLLVTAPIAATNGIEDRHKEGSLLNRPCSVGAAVTFAVFWCRSTISEQMVAGLKRDPRTLFQVLNKENLKIDLLWPLGKNNILNEYQVRIRFILDSDALL